MWPFDADPNQAANAVPNGDTSGFGWGSMFAPDSLLNNPDFRRHAAYDALTQAGLGLIQASAPSPYPTDFGTAFGALAGGAAEGARSAAERYTRLGMQAAQMRNLQMQSQIYPAAMKLLQQGSTYDPLGGRGGAQPPQQAGGAIPPAQQQTAQDESGGNPTAVNPQSGAYGKYQFMAPTWAGVVQAHPDLNLPINMRQATPEQQDAAKAALDQDNAEGLKAAGVTPTPASLYLAHRFGVKGAADFMSAPTNAKISSLFPAQWIDQNPDLQDKTVGQFRLGVAQRYGDFAGGQVQGLPPIPINPPDPSRYAVLKSLGGVGATVADSLQKADEAKYKAAKDLYELSLKGSAEARARAQAAVGPTGQPQPGLIAAAAAKEAATTTAKTQAEMKAHEQSVFGSPNWAQVPPDQFRKMANPQVIALADGLQSGQTRLSTLGNRTGTGGVTISKADILTAGQKLYGADFNPDAGDIRFGWENDAKDSDKQIGKTIMAINTVYKHLDRYQDLVLAQQNGDKPRINSIMKMLNNEAGYNKYTSAETLQPALGTEIANVIKGAQLNMPEVEGSVDSLKTTKSDPQMLDTVQTLRHAMGDRESTISESAAAHYVPPARVEKLFGPSTRKAIQHFDQVQTEYRTAHPERFGGAPQAAPAANRGVRTFDPTTGTLK